MHLLNNYILNPKCPDACFNLANWYYDKNQYASAVSFYCKVNDLSKDSILVYTSLLRLAKCYVHMRNRDTMSKSFCEHAIALLPDRPEAYLEMSYYWERKEDWPQVKMYAAIGRSKVNGVAPLPVDLEYNPCLLDFQYALGSWTAGCRDDARQVLQDLKDKLYIVPDNVKQLVHNNSKTFMAVADYKAPKYYRKYYNDLKNKFPGSENIVRNYSQFFQDMFVLTAHNGKRDGFYLELGAADPIKNNNTYLLESEFGWKGISIDITDEFERNFNTQRPNATFLNQDARTVDYETLLPETVDYLQVDIDTVNDIPGELSLEVLDKIPFDKVKFGVISYEHDHYLDLENKYKNKSREFFISKGYLLAVPNVSVEGICALEDWWVHPDLIPQSVINNLTVPDTRATHVMKYFLEKVPYKYRRRPWVE